MIINIDLFYSLKKYCSDKLKGNESSFSYEINNMEAVLPQALLSLLNIPEEEVGFLTSDGVKIDWDSPIKDGDSIKIYPVIIAG